jgi:hypothetical protein
MLADMRSEVTTFAPLVGKKAFVFLSGGFEFRPGRRWRLTRRRDLPA